MLELENCTIGKGKVLYTIDAIRVPAGKLTVLIGANGAGKSTLLDAIALGDASGGSIAFDGKSLSLLSTEERSHYIALVESRFSGAEYLSTQEYLDLGRFPHTGFQGRLNEHDHAVVARIVSELHLDHLLSQSTLTLSDGERQRTSIARALIQETPVILLDEPTSFLDYPNKRAIMQLLRERAVREQKVILMASHDLELCLEYSDECLIIHPETHRLEQYTTADLSLEQLIARAFVL